MPAELLKICEFLISIEALVFFATLLCAGFSRGCYFLSKISEIEGELSLKRLEKSEYHNLPQIKADKEDYFRQLRESPCDMPSLEITKGEKISGKNAADFFNVDSVAGIWIRKSRLMPSLLSGFGIFFTFVGLSAGCALATESLSLTTMASLPEISQLMGGLFQGSRLAFWTSCEGLLLSLFYSIFLNLRISSLRERLDTLNRELNREYPVVTQAELQIGLLREISSLKGDWSQSFSSALDRSLSGFKRGIEKNLSSVHQSLSRSIDEIEAASDSVKSNFEAFNSEIKECSQEISSHAKLLKDAWRSNEKALRENLTTLTGTLSSTTQTFADVQRDISEMSASSISTVKSLHKALKDSVGEVTAPVNRMLEENKNLLEKFDQSAQSLSSIASAINTSVLNLDCRGPIENLRENIKGLSSDIQGNVSERLEKTEEKIGKEIGEISQRLEKAEGASSALKEEVFKKIEEITPDIVQVINSGLKDSSAKSSEDIKALANNINKLEEDVLGLSSEIMNTRGTIKDMAAKLNKGGNVFLNRIFNRKDSETHVQ